MKYLVRLNKKAWNPILGKVIEGRVWEVEQVANKDSAKCIWHCANVKIRRNEVDTPISQEITQSGMKVKPTEIELAYSGIAVRGQDDSIVIDVRNGHDVS